MTDTTQPIVIVSGLPRSGTSMMMKMLEAGGLPVMTDQLRVADEDNPKGYYEFERVKQLPKGDFGWLDEGRGKVVKIISFLLQNLPPTHPYKVVFMRRNLPEVLASQRKMLVRRGEPTDRTDDAQMRQLYEKHLRQIEGWMASQPNFSTLYVHYSDMLANPQAQVDALDRFFDGALDSERMMAVVDPALYRNR